MFSVIQLHGTQDNQRCIFKQVDLLTKQKAEEWLAQNLTLDIDEHWIIKTSSILKFAQPQLERIQLDDDINLSGSGSIKNF